MRKPRKFTNLNGKEAEFKKAYNELVDYVLATAPLSTPNSLVTRTTQGTNIRPKATASNSDESSDQFRGEWSEDIEDIKEGEWVLVRGTINAGSYRAMVDDPEGEPWDSADWLQFAHNSPGPWL